MSKRYSRSMRAGGPDGDIRTTPRKTNILYGKPQTGHDSQAPNQLANPHAGSDALIAEATAQLLTYTDGWLRLTPDREHKTLFLKFKWKDGQWRGYYVMSVVPPHELGLGLDLLLNKVIDVYAGTRRPTKDTAYDV